MNELLSQKDFDPTRLEIVLPTVEDAESIGRMHLQSWLETYVNPALGVDEAWIRDHLGFLVDETGTAFRTSLIEAIANGDSNNFYLVVKDVDGSIGGFVHAVKQPDEQYNKLDGLYLLEAYQGSGIGFQLFDRAMDWLTEEKPVELEVVAYNASAIEFYNRTGFDETGEVREWQSPVSVARMIYQPATKAY